MIRAHAFVGLDVPKDTIAVAVADGQAGGEVRFWGNIENTPERLRALTDKLASRYQTVEFTYEAGPYRQKGGGRDTVGRGRGLGRGFLKNERKGYWHLAEAALPGVKRHRADAESPAELGDREVAVLLALDRAAPPFAPRWATCRRSESEHGRSPGEIRMGSGIEATMGAKDGSAERLPHNPASLCLCPVGCNYLVFIPSLFGTLPGDPIRHSCICEQLYCLY
jgi:hypothetical protein